MRPAALSLTSLLLISLTTAPAAAGEVSVTYRFGDPVIERLGGGFSRIIFPSTIQAGKAGGPSYPFRGCQILLPPGQEADGVRVKRSGWKVIGTGVRLYPRQNPLPGTDIEGVDRGFLYDSEAYSTDRMIRPPDARFSTHYLRGHGIAVGSFSPASYNPASGEAGFFSEVEVTVTTAPLSSADGRVAPLRRDGATIRRISDIVDNPGALSQYEGGFPALTASGDDYEYMIITPADFEDDFAPLRDFYTMRGVRSRIMTLEHIDANYSGADAQERIRSAISDQYAACGIGYVLLGGDGDPGGLLSVPFRGLYCGVVSSSYIEDDNIPADLYYAALDGDWNTDADTLWGEPGEEDFYPEVAVGRACVDDPSEIATFIMKTTMYQESPVASQARNALMLGEHLWSDPLTYGGNELDQLIDTCSAYGFYTDGIPPDFDITKYYDRDIGSWYDTDVFAEVSAGTNWLCHAGHSNSVYVMRISRTDVNETNFTNDGVTAGFPIMYSYGCYAGAFDADDCIAEEFMTINTGAAAMLVNSRYGWFHEGTNNGPSHHLQREFVDAVFTEGYRSLGWANQRSKDETAPFVDLPGEYEPGAHRWCFYCLNLLGDPCLEGWTDTPTEMPVIHPGMIARSDTFYPAETDQPGALAALYFGGTCYGRAESDQQGRFRLRLSEPIGAIDSLILTVTAHDRIAYRDTVLVVESTGGEVPAPGVTLDQNHPNPFNPVTVISFSLDRECTVGLRIYDVSGKEIACLVDRPMEAGRHSIPWRPDRLASGIYFYALDAGGVRISRKAVLLR